MDLPLIVDAHNDLVQELDDRRDERAPFERHWRGQLEEGGVALQVCPICVADERSLREGPLRAALRQASAFHRALDENGDAFVHVASAADLDLVEGRKRRGLLLAMEGAEALGRDPELLEPFWRLGVRMISLTHNARNAFAEGALEPSQGGLSSLGRRLVDEIARLGMLLDLAHASERTFDDALERSAGTPVLVSHAGCRACCDTPRNISDGRLRALAARDGVLCIMMLPLVVDPANPTIERMLDHVDHAVDLVGVQHVGLGSDFALQVAARLGWHEPLGWVLRGSAGPVSGPRDFRVVIDALARRGYADDEVALIAGGNLLRLLRAGLPGIGDPKPKERAWASAQAR